MMSNFQHIINSQEPSLSLLREEVSLYPEEYQALYDWLLQEVDFCNLIDIQALAICRTNGAIHQPERSIAYTEERFEKDFDHELISQISSLCQRRSQDVFLVGGCVRDILLDIDFSDIDCCLEEHPSSFVEALEENYGGCSDEAVRFGAVHWHAPSGETVDFTQTRREYYPQKGALPTVEPESLMADLARRDFTINAMAIALHPDKKNTVFDPFQGRKDLHNHTLRVLHPLSFWDDPTRIFRAARYAGRYRLQYSAMTQHALQFALQDIEVGTDISWQRIGQEITLIFWEKDPLSAWEKLSSWNVLATWFPSWRTIDSLFKEAQAIAQHSSIIEKTQVYWLVLCLSLPEEEREQKMHLVSQRPILRKLWLETPSLLQKIQANLASISSKSDFATFIHQASTAQILALSVFLPSLRSLFEWWIEDGRYVSSDVRAIDLLMKGCPRGPLIGQALLIAKQKAWDGASAEEQLQEAQKFWIAQTENDTKE